MDRAMRTCIMLLKFKENQTEKFNTQVDQNPVLTKHFKLRAQRQHFPYFSTQKMSFSCESVNQELSWFISLTSQLYGESQMK